MSQQDVAGMYTAFRDLHQLVVALAPVEELAAAVSFARVMESFVVGIKSIGIITLSSLERSK
jgi:hypothetical protein